MARGLYASVLVELPGNVLAPDTVVTFWSELQGGIRYTDLTTPNGVTSLEEVRTDANGMTPELRGPDFVETMYADAGAGVRFPFYATDELKYVLDQFRSVVAQIVTLGDQIDALQNGGGGGGGGLPVGTTLDQIPNGTTRLAMTQPERDKLATVAFNATNLIIGTTATTAKAGNYQPTPAQIGAVQTMSGPKRHWYRTVAQGFPSAAEGAQDDDYLFMDAS